MVNNHCCMEGTTIHHYKRHYAHIYDYGYDCHYDYKSDVIMMLLIVMTVVMRMHMNNHMSIQIMNRQTMMMVAIATGRQMQKQMLMCTNYEDAEADT